MSTSGKSDRIDEPVGIDSLVQHMREIYGGQEIPWRKEKEHNDPPDFWITVAGNEYAVEVTIIVDADSGCDALCNYLCDSIRTEADAVKDIIGKYALTVRERPEIPKRGTTRWKELVSRALTNMRAMSNSPCGAEVCLLKDENGSLAINKLSNRGKTIDLGGPMRWQSKGESLKELSRLFKERIDNKWCKVQKKGVLDACPHVILVFLMLMVMATSKMLQRFSVE